MLQVKGPCLPDFEPPGGVSGEEQEHYLSGLLSSQLSLARSICSDSPFAAILQKRLIVLQRIFFAVASKYYCKDVQRNSNEADKAEEKGEKMTYKKYEARVLEELKVERWLHNCKGVLICRIFNLPE